MQVQEIKKIQHALMKSGFDPGEIDGVWGRRTIAAVRDFQDSKGLIADGIVGPKTATALLEEGGQPQKEPLLPWVAQAEHLIGTKEVLGARSNPIILDWADSLDLRYSGDDVPWCGLFVAHCVASTLPDEILPSNPFGARQWERFGDPTEPRYGAIMVFWRESQSSGKGHVGFYTGEDDDAYRILGGNQTDKVCMTWVSKSHLVKARWPRTGALLGGRKTVVVVNRKDDLSQNEA